MYLTSIDSEGRQVGGLEGGREGGREGGSDRGTEGDSLKIEGRSITYRYPIRDNECVLKCIHTAEREENTFTLGKNLVSIKKKKKKKTIPGNRSLPPGHGLTYHDNYCCLCCVHSCTVYTTMQSKLSTLKRYRRLR